MPKPTYKELEQQVRDLKNEMKEILKPRHSAESSDELHRITLENISDTVIIADDLGKIVYVYPHTRNIFGLTVEDIQRLNSIDELLGGRVCDISELKRLKEMTNVDWTITDKNGNLHYLLINMKAVNIHGGTVLYVMHDITDRRRAELELEKSEKLFRTIVNELPQFIAYADKSLTYRFINPTYQAKFGLPAEEIVGKSVMEVIGKTAFEKARACVEKALAGEACRIRGRFDYAVGGARDIDGILIPSIREDGEVQGYYTVLTDITERKKSQQAFLKSYQELKLNQKIANLFLTSTGERLFNDILYLLLEEFDCRLGYFGYIDENGDLVVPSMTDDVWRKCRMTDKKNIFPQDHWTGLWGKSLKDRCALLRNRPLSTPDGHLPMQNALVVPLVANDQLVGQFVLANKRKDFTPDDQKRLASISDFIAPVLHIYIDKESAQRKLKSNARKIQEQNIALKVLIENRNDENRKMTDSILSSFERMVFPYYEKLKKAHSRADMSTFLDIIEINTQKSLSTLEKSIISAYRPFTPKEIQVADLIKAGKSSKQIAEMLNMSIRSVFFHRNNIRKKLNISNKKANLRSVLASLS